MIKKITDCSQTQKENIPLEFPTQKPAFADRLSRNLALAVLLLIGVVSVKNEQLPSGATVMAAIQKTIQTDWDENLGKISFVSNLFPETVSVFFDTSEGLSLIAPCFGSITHPWNEKEPYLSFSASDQRVYSAAPGQVMSLAHGVNEEKILRIRHENGIETLYYQLETTFVKEGDYVTEKTCIGRALTNEEIIWEVRKNGIVADPVDWLHERNVVSL